MARLLNILQESPHDHGPKQACAPAATEARPTPWIPSRYNVRATTDDGRLVLWNSFSGSMSVFNPEQAPSIKAMLSAVGFEARPEGMVKYLLDRGYLVKQGTDEHRRVQLKFGQKHYVSDTLQLILLSSEDCNFRCQYCYERFERGTMAPWVRDAVKQLVRRRIDQGLKNLSISWFGGEPLYGFKAIEDLGPYFIEMEQKHSIHLSSQMTTNGYLLTPEVADKLLAWKVLRYQITVDGVPEQHDCNRPTRDGQGTFWTIFENLKSLKRRDTDFTVNLRVNFDKGNYPRMDEFLDLTQRELGGDPRFKLVFAPVGKWGGPNDDELAVCDRNEGADMQRQLRSAAHSRGLNIGGTLKDIHFGDQVCYAARPHNFIVGASGKLMKCTVALDTEDYNVVGQIGENGDLNIDFDKLALWTEPAFESDRKCRKCVLMPTCQGMYCPLVRFESQKTPCPTTRMNIKKEMLHVVELGSRGRKVKVPQSEKDRVSPPAVL